MAGALAGQHIVAGDMQKVHIRVLACGLTGAVLHVVGVGDDQPGALLDHVVHKLRDGDAQSVRRVDLVDVDHLNAGHHLFDVFAAVEVGLAPAVVVVRAHQKQAEGERRVSGGCAQREDRREQRQECQKQEPFFKHSRLPGVMWVIGSTRCSTRHISERGERVKKDRTPARRLRQWRPPDWFHSRPSRLSRSRCQSAKSYMPRKRSSSLTRPMAISRTPRL